MSGSIKRHKYDISSDNSGNYLYYSADESNLENITASGGAYDNAGSSIYDFVAADNGVVNLPLPKQGRDFKPRKAIYKDASGNRTRVIPIPSQAMFDDLFNRNTANVNLTFTENIEGTPIAFGLSQLKPQEVAVATEFDSALDDGDVS